MACLYIVTFLALTALTSGQVCYNEALGLTLRMCIPCGSPGLDDFCIKRFGKCGSYYIATGNTAYGDMGGPNGLPPQGYLSGGAFPKTCTTLRDSAQKIPDRNGNTGNIKPYLQAGDWGNSLPRAYINAAILNSLRVLYPLHQCLENNSPFPNGRWNWRNPNDASAGYRTDSFFYEDNGNSTWSYQCYCDFCNSCQQCTNG